MVRLRFANKPQRFISIIQRHIRFMSFNLTFRHFQATLFSQIIWKIYTTKKKSEIYSGVEDFFLFTLIRSNLPCQCPETSVILHLTPAFLRVKLPHHIKVKSFLSTLCRKNIKTPFRLLPPLQGFLSDELAGEGLVSWSHDPPIGHNIKPPHETEVELWVRLGEFDFGGTSSSTRPAGAAPTLLGCAPTRKDVCVKWLREEGTGISSQNIAVEPDGQCFSFQAQEL